MNKSVLENSSLPSEEKTKLFHEMNGETSLPFWQNSKLKEVPAGDQNSQIPQLVSKINHFISISAVFFC